MDIRKYFAPKVSSDHNTRKQQSQSSQDNNKRSKRSTAKSESPKKSPSKKSRKRTARLIDSDDESVTVVEESSTPKKKVKPDNGVAGVRSSPRTKKADKKPETKVKASAADFFGTKKVTSGSTSAPKTIAAKLSQESKKPKVKAKISKEEIVVLGSDEDWSDDESFVKLLDDDKTEEHTDTKFNKTLEQLDKPKAPSDQSEVKSKKRKVNDNGDAGNNEEISQTVSEPSSSTGTPSTRSSRRIPSKADVGRHTPSDSDKDTPKSGSNKSDASPKRKRKDVTGTPSKTPTKPSLKTPTKPSLKTPTKPSLKTPTKPSLKTPTKPSLKTPTKPATKMPTKPATKTPTKPATKTPSKGKAKKGAKYKPLPIEQADSSKGTSVDKSPTSKTQCVQEETPDVAVDSHKPDTLQKARKVKLNGKTFVLTGQMDQLERDEAKELIVKRGGRVVSAISGKVNYLVAGEEAGLAKMAKAEKVSGLKIINESEFLELIGMSSESGVPMETEEAELPSKPAIKVSKQSTPSTSTDRVKEQTTPIVRQTRYSSDDLLWVEKYKPTSMAKIIGQTGDKSNANKLLTWLKNWHRHRKLGTKPVSSFGGFRGGDPTGAGFRAALLSGPPGIGKTTSAVLVCKEAGFSFFEMNASDSRSKKILQETVGQALGNTTMIDYMGDRSANETYNKKHCIIMDEVDGMAGNEDRGGVQELIQLIKGSHIPVICICNDRQSQKIRSLANHCFDLRFQRPRVEQIKAAMKSVCFKEGIQVDGESLNSIIESSNHDIRQVLHNLSVWTASEKKLGGCQARDDSDKAKKDFKIDAFTACRMTFSASETAKMSLKDKSDLFFYDYSIHPLFVQENYIHAVPHASKHSSGDTLKRMAKAANSISMGDVISKAIRTDKWGLLPMQAMFSSVLPAEAVMGHLSKQIDFPKWLGKFSTTNKNFRLNKEISMHMGLNVTASARSICTDYLPILRDKLTVPLIRDEQSEGVKQVIGLLEQYDLLKDDYDSILELTQWPGVRDPRTQIESKTKAALTRQYNKSSHKLHYSLAVAPVKKKRAQATAEDLNEEDDVDDSEEESDEDVVNALKVSSKKPAAKGKAQTGKGKAAADKTKPAKGSRKKK